MAKKKSPSRRVARKKPPKKKTAVPQTKKKRKRKTKKKTPKPRTKTTPSESTNGRVVTVAISRKKDHDFPVRSMRRKPISGPLSTRLRAAHVHHVPFETAHEVGSRKWRFNNHFSLRFYIPRETTRGNPPSRLFIMLNGFAEATVGFWDHLANSLAAAGVASVLLPLPDHFCRNVFFNINDFHAKDPYQLREANLKLNEFTAIMKFEAIRHPDRFLDYNLQIQADIRKLIDILPDPSAGSGAISEFIKRQFRKRVRITLIGYSLGGLCALQAYLAETKLFEACILINAGASFQDMDASTMFGRDDWRALQLALVEAARKNPEEAEKHLFSQVILGHAKVELQQRLAQNCHKILVLLGGKDVIINYKNMANLEPADTGLAIFQIPGLEHHVNIKRVASREWNPWSDFAVQMILAFEERHPKHPTLPEDVEATS